MERHAAAPRIPPWSHPPRSFRSLRGGPSKQAAKPQTSGRPEPRPARAASCASGACRGAAARLMATSSRARPTRSPSTLPSSCCKIRGCRARWTWTRAPLLGRRPPPPPPQPATGGSDWRGPPRSRGPLRARAGTLWRRRTGTHCRRARGRGGPWRPTSQPRGSSACRRGASCRSRARCGPPAPARAPPCSPRSTARQRVPARKAPPGAAGGPGSPA
mmetsp:Transcript_2889/g.6787  ORF Transcript_2889/g.6787 Transcript_2889/m.6787 type:complete len:217 (+) Transcript_2889:1173-1823(+)